MNPSKTLIFLLLLTTGLLLSTGQLFAANKVVVVPLGGGDVTTKEFNAQHVWTGLVGDDGAKQTTGLFTSSRSSVGSYRIELNLDGFDIPWLGFESVPIIFATPDLPLTPGASALRSLTSVTVNNGKITSLRFDIKTYNGSDALTDIRFGFLAKFPEPNPPSMSSKQTARPAVLDEDGCSTIVATTVCFED